MLPKSHEHVYNQAHSRQNTMLHLCCYVTMNLQVSHQTAEERLFLPAANVFSLQPIPFRDVSRSRSPGVASGVLLEVWSRPEWKHRPKHVAANALRVPILGAESPNLPCRDPLHGPYGQLNTVNLEVAIPHRQNKIRTLLTFMLQTSRWKCRDFPRNC